MPSNPAQFNSQTAHGGKALLTGGVAALLASACCLGPLVLIGVGLSGAWVGHLTALEPYQPLFAGIASIALIGAGRKIWRPASDCEEGTVCAMPRVRQAYKWIFTATAILLGLSVGFPLIAHWFY